MNMVPLADQLNLFTVSTGSHVTVRIFDIVSSFTCFDLCLPLGSYPDLPNQGKQPIILSLYYLDSDIFSDIDGIGSLAVPHVLHNHGIANLRGVLVNTRSQHGAAVAASVINT